jgi:2-dehydro-3-deoxygluconokinase
MNIACIGEVMIELSLEDGSSTAQVGVAGDTFNTAVYLKRRGADHVVAYLTVLGTDTFSDQILERISSEHIESSSIPRNTDRVPGLYAIRTDNRGERSFTYWRNQSAARLLFDESTGPSFEVLASFDVLYYSAITLAIIPVEARDRFLSYLAEFRTLPGKQVAFDSNYRPGLWDSQEEAQRCIADAWRQCDIALPSLDDEMALFGDMTERDVIERLKQYGVITGALKRGAEGPLNLADPTNTPHFESVVRVVDSTAAGDSFNGAYLASLLSGANAVQAAQAGHDCASQVVQHRGAIIAVE